MNIIEVTPEMKNKAILRANTTKTIPKSFNGDNSERNRWINKFIGFLGEEVFREYLENKNLYYDETIVNYKNELKYNYDLGDFFGSRYGNSIDVKTTNSKYVTEIKEDQEIYRWRPIDIYVSVSLLPLGERKEFDLDKITSAVINGFCFAEQTFSKQKMNRRFYKIPFKKLIPIDKIDNQFITNEEKEINISRKDFDLTEATQDSHFFFVECFSSEKFVGSTYMGNNLKNPLFKNDKDRILGYYIISGSRRVPKLDYHTLILNNHFISFNLKKNSNSIIQDLPSLVKNIIKASLIAKNKFNKRLLVVISDKYYSYESYQEIAEKIKDYTVDIHYEIHD